MLLALVMVIGLFPVFADEAKVLTAEEAGAILQGYGAIKGGSDGDLMIDKELKRQDAVVILTRLMGKETDALATQAAPSFEDITIDYYKPFLAFAEANKWVEGKKEKTFGFNDVTTVKEFAAMLLRALGHDTTGENYPKVMELAKELKLFNGATVEENAPIVRGIAFILMNNTLETAPKGEDKALVYKLGYKEEPKPQGFVVTEAKAAGRKAIDVKFSKAVDEKTLFNFVIKDGPKSVVIDKKIVSDDAMTVRLVLLHAAKQDANYTLRVGSVKTVDGKETVEKFEAKVSMTDQVRPEVLSVEVLNPKTFVVKTSEPIDFTTMKSFSSLKNFKIEGKEMTVKVMNAYKDEIIVEFYNALKPGDYKLEVSGLKDFDGLIAKTMEFDITVVEDKEAPVIASARMITVQALELTFNEPVKTKGSFKVNGKNIAPSKISIDEDDAKIVYLQLTNELDLGAVTEVSVQHKGQRDAMNNTVKDWTKFTFKVEDDTELPAVESVSVDGTTVFVRFNKAMYETGKYYVKNAKGKVIRTGYADVSDQWINGKSLFYFDVKEFKDVNSDDYTIVLEGFKDGTVRGNKLPTTELPLASQDLKAPTAVKKYVFGQKDGYVYAHIFFDEDMDVSSLEDPKNYTFSSFFYGGVEHKNYRADSALADLTFTVRNGSSEVIIEANTKKITKFGDITLLGQKDLAGNLLDKQVVEPRGEKETTQFVEKAYLVRGEGGEGYQVVVDFKDGIKSVSDEGVFRLVNDLGVKISELKKFDHMENSDVVKFKVEKPNMVTPNAKTYDNNNMELAARFLKLELIDGSKAVSVYGEDATNMDKVGVGAKAAVIVDKVAPRLTETALNGDIKIDEKASQTIIGDAPSAATQYKNVIFDQKVMNAVNKYSINVQGIANHVDYNEPGNIQADGYTIKVNKVLKPGVYRVTINKVIDANDTSEMNTLENVSFDVTVGGEEAAKIEKFEPKFDATGKLEKIEITFDKYIVDGTDLKNQTEVFFNDEGTKLALSSVQVDGVDKSKLVITLTAAKAFGNDGTTLKVQIKEEQLKDVNGNVLLGKQYVSEKFVAAKLNAKIVSAKEGNSEKVVIEFNKEIGSAAIADSKVQVFKKDGTHMNKYDKAKIINGNQVEIWANADDGDLAENDEIYVKIITGHKIYTAPYENWFITDDQETDKTEYFKVTK